MRLLYFVISSSILIGLVLIVRKMFRKQIAPGMLYALWLIPLIRLLVPFGIFEMPVFGTAAEIFRAPYTVLAEAGDLWGRLTEEKAGSFHTDNPDSLKSEEILQTETQGIPAEQNQTALSETGGMEDAPSEVIPHTSAAEPETASSLQAVSRGVWLVLAAVWFGGSILLCSYAAVSNRRLKKSICRMEEARTDCLLPVCVSDAVVSPCLFGLFHPCILVNRTVTEDPVLCHYVLEHELTHYRQKDHIWTFLRILLRIVYWWNPLVWIGTSCAGEDAELSCDAKVIRGLSADERKAYGYSLLRLLKNAQRKGPEMCIATSMSGGRNSLKRRMEGIAAGTKTKKQVLLPVCLLLTAMMLYGCSVPSVKNWMKAAPEDRAAMESPVDYELSLQDEIQSRLFYYEIYRYGELTQRRVMAYGKLEGEDRRNFRAELALLSEESEENEKLEFKIENAGVTIDFPIIDTAESAEESYADMLRGRSVLWGDGKKQEVKAGDDLILMADYYQSAEKDSLSAISCETLMEQTDEELSGELADAYVTVLIHMVLSDRTEEQLFHQYSEMEYPKESVSGTDISGEKSSEMTEAEKFVQSWADAFVDRDGHTLQEMMSEEAWKGMSEEGGLVIEEEDYTSFGWSSPWPMSPDNNYRILSCDEESAEILYYAWVSDPHMYVWKETLQLAQQDGNRQVTGENLKLLDYITSAEEYYMAYPEGKISGTMMDYISNGMGEALNQNAQNSRDNAVYSRLFDPEGAACYLLNIAGLSYGVVTDESEWVTTSAQDLADGTVSVQITFLEDGRQAEVVMVQPWGAEGIWIPQTYGSRSGQEDTVYTEQTGESAPGGRFEPSHREDFEKAELTYVLPDSMKEQYADQGWNMAQLEDSAQRALQDLYDLTGTKVESCVYMSINNGSYYFAKTAEDMNRGRVFYTRSFQEQEGMIPSMDMVNAGNAGYSDIRQLLLPPDAGNMDDGELAVWFLQKSPLYRGESVSYTEAVSGGQPDTTRIVMEDGTFYEIQIDRKIQAVLHIAGPYPKGFSSQPKEL